MASKLQAARIASWSGVRAVIARAGRADVLADAVGSVPGVGTTFEGHDRKLGARKLWIAFASAVAGTVVVDDGARTALVERNTSLLHAGVREVRGEFEAWDTVQVVGLDGSVIARGMVSADADSARRAAGLRSNQLPGDVMPELVHRDDLVIVL